MQFDSDHAVDDPLHLRHGQAERFAAVLRDLPDRGRRDVKGVMTDVARYNRIYTSELAMMSLVQSCEAHRPGAVAASCDESLRCLTHVAAQWARRNKTSWWCR